MDLQDNYKKESGFDVGTINTIGTTYYSDDYVEWLEDKVENLILFGVGVELPTKEEMLSNLDFKVENWLLENTKDEITGFKVGFKSCYRWIKRKLKENGN